MIKVNASIHVEPNDVIEGLEVQDAAQLITLFADMWTEQGWTNLENEMIHHLLETNPQGIKDVNRLGKLLIKVSGGH